MRMLLKVQDLNRSACNIPPRPAGTDNTEIILTSCPGHILTALRWKSCMVGSAAPSLPQKMDKHAVTATPALSGRAHF